MGSLATIKGWEVWTDNWLSPIISFSGCRALSSMMLLCQLKFQVPRRFVFWADFLSWPGEVMDRDWLDIILISSSFLSTMWGRVMVAPEAMAAMKEPAREKWLGRLLGRQILTSYFQWLRSEIYFKKYFTMENKLSNWIVTYCRFPKKCTTKNVAFNTYWHVKQYLKLHCTSFWNLKSLSMFI